MISVACVLRSGDEYLPEHVVALKRNVARWLAIPHRFVCLTDQPIYDVHSIMIGHDWPRWWPKIELFRKGMFPGPVFYVDLDTVIVAPIDDLVLGHRFTVLRNFWVPEGHERIGSGLMAWEGDLSGLYETFTADPARHMAECVEKERWGDQGFIQHHSPVPMDRWQVKHPGRVVSYRKHCTRGIPPGASVVCFGGPIRPWMTPLWG